MASGVSEFPGKGIMIESPSGIRKGVDVTLPTFHWHSMAHRPPSMAVDVASTTFGRVSMSHRLRFAAPE